MPYNEKLPEWLNPGQEPPSSRKAGGWNPQDRPPAEWMNYHQHRTYQALKELQENATHKEVFQETVNVVEDINKNMVVPKATEKLGQSMGINVHTLTQEKALKLKSYGFKYIRMDMRWTTVETSKGVYDFSVYDTRHSILLANGLIPYYILDYVNPLYGNENNLVSQVMADGFVNFALACVNRYKNSNGIWEIYNEPNGGFWTPQTADTPAQYTNVVKRLYTQIKTMDPLSIVVGPALATKGSAFFESCCKAGLLNNIDAVTIHPYTPEQPETLQQEYEMFSAIIGKYSNKPIPLWCGEFGYSTVPNWDGIGNNTVVNESTQAKYLVRSLLLNVMNGINKTVIYVDSDSQNPVSTNVEDYFGIFHNDGTEKPSSTSIKNILVPLEEYYFAERLPSQGDDYILKFIKDEDEFCYVAWTIGEAHSIDIAGTTMQITDMPSVNFSIQENEKSTFAANVFNEMQKVKNTALINKLEISQYGVGPNYGSLILRNVDLNDYFKINTTVPVDGSSCTNLPFANAYGSLFCFGQRGTEISQLFIASRSNRLFTRTKLYDTGWTNWDEKASLSTLTTFGVGASPRLQNVDLNNYFTLNRIASVDGATCTNLPFANAYGSLFCFGQTGVEIVQLFIASRSNRMFTRAKLYDTGWTAWDEKLSATSLTKTDWINQSLLNNVQGSLKCRKIGTNGVETVSLYINVSNLPAGVGTLIGNISTFATSWGTSQVLVCPQDRFNKKSQALLDPNGDIRIYTDTTWTTTDVANGLITYIK